MQILFVFVDGIGLGEDDADVNPFARASLPAFERLAGGRRWVRAAPVVDLTDLVFRPLDATLGVKGLPQSGTGQASLFTGVNCARLAGRHYGPYPHSNTRSVLAEKNIFRQIEALERAADGTGADQPAAFANAYPDRFFDYVKRTDRWTVTTRCCLESSVRIRTEADLRKGLAVPADLVGQKWPGGGDDGMMPASEGDAARRLLRIAARHTFTLFEYYLTDKAGHKQSMASGERVLGSLDALLSTLLDEMDSAETLLILTSDHGNLEDLSTKTHTRNPVPLAACGAGADALRAVRSIEDVTPAVLAHLADRSPAG